LSHPDPTASDAHATITDQRIAIILAHVLRFRARDAHNEVQCARHAGSRLVSGLSASL
jgi:hypothetical protein